MSDLYTALQVSPKKKRCPPDQGELVVTPKKLRTAPPTPPPTRKGKKTATSLPSHLSRLLAVQTALQHALSHALATCAVSPSSDTGIVRNVLNHFSLTTYTGLTTKFAIEDLQRLCWLWEWDGKTLPDTKGQSKMQNEGDDNPFLDLKRSKDWTRGSMGFVLSPTNHLAKNVGKRVPAYGIGIEVEMDIDKDMKGGMAAVARWTAASATRLREFRAKLDSWVDLHSEQKDCPSIPLADLPKLPGPTKSSSLTQIFASVSPKASTLSSSLELPLSSDRSPSKSPTKKAATSQKFAVPVSPIKSLLQSKNTVAFPQTPSRHGRPGPISDSLTPRTPTTSTSNHATCVPSTPVSQRGANAQTFPETPSSSRRQAIYERVRQRSLSLSPSKSSSGQSPDKKYTKDHMLKMSQDEMRRRCLLGRLGGVAESIWMLFSTPAGPTATPTIRKRRALPISEVVTAVMKSSPISISSAEATESISLLKTLCPFFLKILEIGGENWVEMPGSSALETAESQDGKKSAPPSPGPKKESAEVLVSRSPRWVKREAGGLREVREIVRRELELHE